MAPDDDKPLRSAGVPLVQALDARTEVVRERGQWVVYLEVQFWNETRRFYIETYRSERRAQIAAEMIRRYADQDLPFPPTGF